jgi:hypothetical protein
MGLSFLTPLLLGGAALVAVPIVLHLLMRRKPVRHEFPAVRFLRQTMQANRRRLRVQHLLLLLLRMAAIALVALALARPVLRGAGWLGEREGPVAAAFVFDTAPRMDLRDANRTRLEQAATLARVLLAKLPPSSKVATLDTGGGAAAFAPLIAAAAARIDRLAVATPAVTLRAAIDDGLRLLETSSLARKELYVFTDCSHGAWDNVPAVDAAESHPGTSVLFIDVSAPQPRNFAIGAVDLSNERIAAATSLTVTADLLRTGPEAVRPVAVEMLGPDGSYARRAVKPVTWRADGSQQVDFEIAGLEPGVRQGRVVIEGSDELEADNARSFTVEVGAPARIVVAAPAPARRTGFFVAEAIAPTAMRKAGRARFDAAIVDVATLADGGWEDARGMVLVDPPPLAARTWEAIEQWVAGGRGLVVWLGPRAGDPARFNGDASRRVLGGRLVRVWRSAGKTVADPDFNYIAPQSLDHPLLAVFRRVGDAVPWQDFPVWRHWEFTVDEEPAPRAGAEPAAAAAVVAGYRNGLPALLERRVGQGTVIVATTPVSQAANDPDAWNMLTGGLDEPPWPFLILANETMLRAIDTADERNVTTGTPVVLHLDRRDVATAFVRNPSGDEFPAAVDQRRGTITVTATQLPGNYAVRVGGDVGGTSRGFSANLAPAATDFVRLDDARIGPLLGPGHRLARSEADLVRDVNLERIGAELYGWIIVLAALAMAADWIVANRFYAPRVATGPRPVEEIAESFADSGAAGPGPVPPPVPPAVPPSAPPPGPPPVPPPVPQEVGT